MTVLKYDHTITIPEMICSSCEKHKHYECIDCQNDHKTELCTCDCHIDSEMHKH